MSTKTRLNGNPNNSIVVEGARLHNLKNISLTVPRNKLVVVTGVSGSGKSSLVFDTLYAEGHRRYVESLSSYARQFFGKMHKPAVDRITGLSPAVAVEQKVCGTSPRSTVATSTEIYDYLKILFARCGKTISPVSGKEVKKHSVRDVIQFVQSLEGGTKIFVMAPVSGINQKNAQGALEVFLRKGFSRLKCDDQIFAIAELLPASIPSGTGEISLLIDRLTVDFQQDDFMSRLTDSVETAFIEGKGNCMVEYSDGKIVKTEKFSDKFDLDGIRFEEPVLQLFGFNSPFGACRRCEGFGQTIGIDEDLVVPDKSLSVYDGAIACWNGEKMSEWKDAFLRVAHRFDFPVHRPFNHLTEAQKELLWNGNKHFRGINDFFKYVESQTYKIQYRVMQARYRGKTICPDCRGSRLRKEALYVRIGGKNIHEIVSMPVADVLTWFRQAPMDDHHRKIADRALTEIISRLETLLEIGLGYLTLNRPSNTLSGGESQRLNLSRILGSPLVGSIYILDEPSIGLHHRDTMRLVGILKKLRDRGNTVMVVEHDEEIIRNADYVIDMGPGAGVHGGEVVFSGLPEKIKTEANSITARFLNRKEILRTPVKRRTGRNFIEITEAREHNLKNITVKIPLNVLTVVTGVSGSGKSSLVRDILYPAISRILGIYKRKEGLCSGISGDISWIKHLEIVDQNPIGKSTRSNPVTYVKAFDEIRHLFASLPASTSSGYTPAHFSFNVEGGRCEACQGEGEVTIAMQFLADIHIPCDDCKGRRYKDEILDVQYKGKNIADVLDMTVEEAMEFFAGSKSNQIIHKLKPLVDVGMGYIKLGQPASTLSGGEAQRVKLASFIGMGVSQEKTLFIFDEPTTGLHFHDIGKLLIAFEKLLDRGHTLVVIEHNPEVIKYADHIIDLGPEGGEEGGYVVFEGTPEELIKCEKSYTSKCLRKVMKVIE